MPITDIVLDFVYDKLPDFPGHDPPLRVVAGVVPRVVQPVHLKVPLSYKYIGCSVADPVSDMVVSVNFFRIQIQDQPVHLKVPLSYKNMVCSVADPVSKNVVVSVNFSGSRYGTSQSTSRSLSPTRT